MAIITTLVGLGVLLVFTVLGCVLEVFLARRESIWPGLALPILAGLYAVVMALLSLVGYVIVGISKNTMLTLLVPFGLEVVLIICIVVLKRIRFCAEKAQESDVEKALLAGDEAASRDDAKQATQKATQPAMEVTQQMQQATQTAQSAAQQTTQPINSLPSQEATQ